jgi:hypothetical protein
MSATSSPKTDTITTGNPFKALQNLSMTHQITSLDKELSPHKQMRFKPLRPNKSLDKSITAALSKQQAQEAVPPELDTTDMEMADTAQDEVTGSHVTKKSVTPSVSNRMAIGAIIPTISIHDITSHASGLGTYISSYFMRTNEPQVHSLNRVWHYPTNGNVDGNF